MGLNRGPKPDDLLERKLFCSDHEMEAIWTVDVEDLGKMNKKDV